MTETSVPNGLTKATSRWYLSIAIGLSLIFLYLAIRGVNWDQFISTILHCDLIYLFPAILIALINFFIRSQRWGILVRANQPVPTLTMFWSTGIGYLGNNFLPLRTGEILRSVALGYKTGISKIYVLATALTERVIDAIFLIILGILFIPSIHIIPEWLPPAMWTLGLLGFTAMLLLLFTPHLEKQIKYILAHFPLLTKWRFALQNWLEQFLQGAASFQNLGRSVQFLLLTCLIWLLDALGMMFSGRAFSLDISISQSLLLLVGLGLSSAIPSAPGYIGVFQFVAVSILAVFGYPKSQVLAFIVVAQAISLILTLLWGLVSLGGLRKNYRSLYSDSIVISNSRRD